jgi:uncharacterized protein (TIGR02302 family)
LDGSGDELNRDTASAQLLLRHALRRARGSLLWERLWPALAGLATAVGLFLAFSWAGLWLALPPLGRAIGLFIFAVLIGAAVLPLVWVRFPNVIEGLRRLDRGSGEPHRPATAIADEMSANRDDPVAQALWRAHIERALLSAQKLKAGWPSPRIAARDPMALRALVLLMVVATFFAAGGERMKRIGAAFDWHGVVAPANYRIDAWINPPLYTGRPPVMLPGMRPGETAQAANAGAPVSVPAGSQLVVRATGKVQFDVAAKGGIDQATDKAPTSLPPGTEERHYVIRNDGTVTLHGPGSNDVIWRFAAIEDKAPTIALTKDPERQARGSLRLDYKIDDDYGVVEAKATFDRKQEPARDGKSDAKGADKTPRPLFGAPSINLALPQARTRTGVGQTTHDLSDHPWAGAEVSVTLSARDEAGNVGTSEPRDVVLPQRIFVKPVARALIEQRRNLAMDANEKERVATALDALTIAPERFTPEAGVYLGLRSIYFDLMNARNDDGLRDVVARMWDMAVHIEDGNVSDAEQALRQAQEALRQALERGASDEELKKLMDNLRAALDKFMQALAEEMRKNPQQLARPLDRNTRTVSPQDLKNMIDRMEQMARSGNKDAARRMLEQLQQMLENLQTARRGGQQSGDDDDDMMSSLDELGDMIRKQQQLRDRTFKKGQQSQRAPQSMDDLKQDQQALRERLNKLLEQLRQRGLGQPGQDGQDGQDGQGKGQGQKEMQQLGEAGDAMGDAEGQIGEGDTDNAVDSQGRALDAMRKGAQSLAQTMQQNGMMGPGPNGQPGRNGQQRAQQNTDPLGRPLRGRDYGDDVTVKVPGEIDAQRARRILEELRRRFADPARPQLELDYIERLLKDF